MTVIDINEITDAGTVCKIPRDENGKVVGYTVEDVFSRVDKQMSEAYGVDFAMINQQIGSGKISLDELTDEMLRSPEFAYKSFTAKVEPLPKNIKPNPDLLDAVSEL